MKKFTLRFYPRAERDAAALPREHLEMINHALPVLEENPFPRGNLIKKIKGKKFALYRLRVNQYRVFYSIEGSHVFVLTVIAKKDADKFIRTL